MELSDESFVTKATNLMSKFPSLTIKLCMVSEGGQFATPKLTIIIIAKGSIFLTSNGSDFQALFQNKCNICSNKTSKNYKNQ